MKQENKQPKERSMHSKDEQARLMALYNQYEQQKVILQYQQDVQKLITNKLNIQKDGTNISNA
jgi:hypothetical protein